jgi:hypothetical protein
MDDPRLEWLNARLAEDEATAKAATPGPWSGPKFDDQEVGDMWMYGWDDKQHIVTWDPARALATVAALRQILELHEPDDEYAPDCAVCPGNSMKHMARWPCPTVRAVASIWAAHADYQEVWGDG